MALVRVEDLDTGHKYSIDERSVDPKAHKVLKDPAADAGGTPFPPEHNPKVVARAAAIQKESGA